MAKQSPNSFDAMLPRTIFAETNSEYLEKEANYTQGLNNSGSLLGPNMMAGNTGGTNLGNIYRNPVRRFYDPEITTTAIYLPRSNKHKNRWNRWFFDHDELIATVLELHADLPYSKFEVMIDDPLIKRHIEDCIDRTNFFSTLPILDLEYLKIGEVFIHTPWNNKLGMWDSIVVHNPDFVEVKYSPFADQENHIELLPSDELKSIIYSTKPDEQHLKKKIPENIIKRVLGGRNIVLDPDEVTHIARRSNPYDVRGTSIIERAYRLLMYEDKLREAQITIADNFIYPLKLFKLGDPQKGWIPKESHQKALAQMLQQAQMDPHFSLIYHYGLQVEYITVADKVMRLDKEWDEINKKKMIALGISQQFLSGESTYASANVGLQTQLARYKAKRDLFEERFIKDKFFRGLAEKNQWYARDKKEIVGNYRVKRSDEELQERLMIPKIVWHKKLMLRDDQSYLNFLNNVYANGKGPLSTITFFMSMGLDLEDELRNKKKEEEVEARIGMYLRPQEKQQNITAKLKNKLKFGKKDSETLEKLLKEHNIDLTQESKFFTGEELSGNNKVATLNEEEVLEQELNEHRTTSLSLNPVGDDIWFKNLQASAIPSEASFLMINSYSNIKNLYKKYGSLQEIVSKEDDWLIKTFVDTYMQGKLSSYSLTNYLPIHKNMYATSDTLKDFSDIAFTNQFENWIQEIIKLPSDDNYKISTLRNLYNTCFEMGQLKGYQEQGVNIVKANNVLYNDGLIYKIGELLSKSWNLGGVLSPENEVAMFTPCIEGYEDESYGNNIDPHIEIKRSFYVNNIHVKDCPIEYYPPVENFLRKMGKFLRKKYNTIIFVKDILDLPEWEEEYKKRLKKSNIDLDDVVINSKIYQDRISKKGTEAILDSGDTLYISSWIGVDNTSIVDSLIKYVDYETDYLIKAVNKNFKNINIDLSQDEIDTYRVLGYIKPVMDSDSEVIGWQLNEKIIKEGISVEDKLVQGKIWNAKGKCSSFKEKDPMQLFNENLKLWISYPHKLSYTLKKSFENLYE